MVAFNRFRPPIEPGPRADEPWGSGHNHRLGEGFHPLPLHCVTDSGVEQLTSAGCILLLFTIWAQRRGYDAVEVYMRANRDAPRLRPDLLLFYRQWTEVPPDIDCRLLCRDLDAIEEHALVGVLDAVQRGGWRPPSAYSHWVVTDEGRIVGEARDLDPADRPDEHGQHFCFVRLFEMPEMAEWGYADSGNLIPKAVR